jgi:hypothetical protein
MAMFPALALGAPVGTALYSFGGFARIAMATVLVPFATMLLVAALSPIPPLLCPAPPTPTYDYASREPLSWSRRVC